MYSYIKGEVKFVEHRPRSCSVVTVAANGLGIPLRVYGNKSATGEQAEYYVLSSFSDREGYVFYGFQEMSKLEIARRLLRETKGVGPEGVAALVNTMTMDNLRKIGRGVSSAKFAISGLGAKKEAELRRALAVVFKDAASDFDGDLLGASMDECRMALAGFGVQVDEALLTRLALEFPSEEITSRELVGKYLEHHRNPGGAA